MLRTTSLNGYVD